MGHGVPHPALVVVDHPLVRDKMTRMRSVDADTRLFRELSLEVAAMVAFEATRALPEECVDVETPLEWTQGTRVVAQDVLVVPVLRAGLGLVGAFERLIPGVAVVHVGMARDEDTLEPTEYYFAGPPDLRSRHVMVADPMLATGGTAVAAISGLKERGADLISFVCLVAAPEGVDALVRAHPDVRIFAAALDRQLNEKGYILPGLGDAGDRLFGTD